MSPWRPISLWATKSRTDVSLRDAIYSYDSVSDTDSPGRYVHLPQKSQAICSDSSILRWEILNSGSTTYRVDCLCQMFLFFLECKMLHLYGKPLRVPCISRGADVVSGAHRGDAASFTRGK